MNPTSVHTSCHCGALTVALTLAPGQSVQSLPVRACQCSYCRPRRARWTAEPTGSVAFFGQAKDVSRYRFGTRTAEFLVCRTCGVLAAAVSEIDGRRYAVVNADMIMHAFGVPVSDSREADFEGEPVAERLARRARSWTPVVSVFGE